MRIPSHPHAMLALVVAVLTTNSRVDARDDPGPVNGTFPSCVRLVGSNGVQAPQQFGGFEVILLDIASNPVPGALMRVDFSAIPELIIAADQPDPEAIVDCAGRSVSKVTDVNGRAVFCIVGASTNAVPGVTLLNGCRIYGNGRLCASPTANAYDLDGMSGLGAADLTVFLNDFASGLNLGRSDFDCSGNLGANDLSIWLRAFASGTQLVSASAGCP
jgi:hypothetical protein